MTASLKKTIDNILNWINARNYTGYGTAVELSYSYTSSSSQYTAPANGIITANCNYRAGQYVMVWIDGVIVIEGTANSSGNHSGNMILSVPILKGQKTYCTVNTTAYSAVHYRPFV